VPRPYRSSLAGRAKRIWAGLELLLVGTNDDETRAVVDGGIITPAGVVIRTGKVSATRGKTGYMIQSACPTFGTSGSTGRGRTFLGTLEWLQLGAVDADFSAENLGRGRLVTTKPRKKQPSTALVKTVTGYPSFKTYIRAFKPPKPTAAGSGDEDDD
jgi:hypothetical protein